MNVTVDEAGKQRQAIHIKDTRVVGDRLVRANRHYVGSANDDRRRIDQRIAGRVVHAAADQRDGRPVHRLTRELSLGIGEGDPGAGDDEGAESRPLEDRRYTHAVNILLFRAECQCGHMG